jgi:uncharacterized Zn-finger protein
MKVICPECHTAFDTNESDYTIKASDGLLETKCPYCDSQFVITKDARTE